MNYSIVSGDTLWGIAKKTYGDKLKSDSDIMKAIDYIAKKNNISDPNLIYAGDNLNLPKYESIFESSSNTTKTNKETPKDDEKVSYDDFNNWVKTGVAKFNANDEYEVEDFDMVQSDISYKDKAFIEPYKEAVSDFAKQSIKAGDIDGDSALSHNEYIKQQIDEYNDTYNENLIYDEKTGRVQGDDMMSDFLDSDFNVLDADKNGKLDITESSALYATLDGYDSSDYSLDGKIKMSTLANADFNDNVFQKLFKSALNFFKAD